jgi:hypothetical protein
MVFRASFVIVGVAGLALAAALLAPTVDAQTLQIDDRGFVDTQARCEAPSAGVAFGRTESALVAICLDNGAYEYRGVRLRDDALLTDAATETADGTFEAEQEGVTYTFSAKELVVASGDRVLHTEPMVAYVEPSSTGE